LPTSERVQLLKGMTRRQLEDLKADIERALVVCIVCGEAGASPFHARYSNKEGTLDICPACFDKHRRVPSRSHTKGGGDEA